MMRVSTLDELTAAVEGDDAKIVIIDGTITGDAVVKVGSNTSLLGAAGSCAYYHNLSLVMPNKRTPLHSP